MTDKKIKHAENVLVEKRFLDIVTTNTIKC